MIALMTSSLVVWATEQEDKSGLPGKSHSSEAQGKRLTGQLIHIGGWHYTVKDTPGKKLALA